MPHKTGKPIPRKKGESTDAAALRRIGKALRLLRLEAGLSMGDIAERLGVSYQQVQKYERGTNRLPIDKLYILKHLYRVPYERFFGAP